MKPNNFNAHAYGESIMLSIWGDNPDKDGIFTISDAQALRLAEILARAVRERMEAEDAAAT